jgi:diguanylate cyclase (GGDEF)-like protein
MDKLIWGKLVVIEVEALLSILFWECLASALVILALWKYSTYLENRKLVESAIAARLLFALGYFLLLYRGTFPDFLSSTMGNLLLYAAFYIDSIVSLSMIKMDSKRMRTISSVILGFSFLSYIWLDLVNRSSNDRVALASLIIFLFAALTAFKALFSRNTTPLYRIFGFTYLLVAIAVIPRGIAAFTDTAFTIHTTDVYQTALFLSLLIQSFLGILFFFLFIKIDADRKIEKLAATDYLTGLINRRSYLELGNRQLAKVREEQKLFFVYFLDVDHFKSINDNYGHGKGDQVLIDFGKAFKNSLRSEDLCCRYGGDEFSACAQLPSLEAGKKIIRRFQEEIAKISIIQDITIASSIGIAYGIPQANDTFEAFVEKADEAMYMAKQAGKNQVVALPVR